MVLSDNSRSLVAIGIMLAYKAVSGQPWEKVVPAAAALDLVYSSGELIDKVIDEEAPSVSDLGDHHIANVAWCLQFMAGQALTDLRRRGFSEQAVGVAQDELVAIVAESASSQYRDLEYETDPAITLEQSLGMTRLKGGPLVSGIGRLGARLACSDEQEVQSFVAFGWHTGTYAQLLNDMTDAGPGGEYKTDIRRRKKTLPVVYLLRQPDHSDFQEEKGILSGAGAMTAEQEAEVRCAVEAAGGLEFTAVMAESFRTRALAALDAVGERFDVSEISSALFPQG